MDEVVRRLGRDGAGRIAVALVTRGDRRAAASPIAHPGCAVAGEWCLPRVAATWPPADTPEAGTWNAGGDCAGFTPPWPAAGEHFPADLPVLPDEASADTEPPPPQEDWLSRNLRPQEWWVVVDTCFHPDPGLFGGVALSGLEFFDISDSALVLRERAAWGSIHDYSSCNWCP